MKSFQRPAVWRGARAVGLRPRTPPGLRTTGIEGCRYFFLLFPAWKVLEVAFLPPPRLKGVWPNRATVQVGDATPVPVVLPPNPGV